MTEGGEATVGEDIIPATNLATMSEPEVAGVDKNIVINEPIHDENLLLVVDDPLAPDAPIHHLLSIRHNPLVANMTVEELTVLVRRCREYATSAPTLSAKLATDALNVDPKRRKTNTVAAKKKSILEDL